MNFLPKNHLKLAFLLTLGLQACDSGISKEGELKKRIREASNDQQLSGEEWSDLTRFVQDNSGELSAYSDCAALKDLVSKTMEKKGVPAMPDCSGGSNTNTTTTVGDNGSFQVYVENSASMFGYMQGATEFREALMDIPSRMVGRQQKGEFFFINDKTYPATKDYSQFVELLNKEKAGSKDYGNTAKASNSKLDDILQRVIQEVVSKKTTGMFASDCIFDIDGKNPKDELPNMKFKVKAVMQNLKQKGDYGVLVMKFSSLFDGNYYDCKNGKTVLKSAQRPFYIWVIGTAEKLRTFVRDYNIETVKGFKNYAFFYNSQNTAESLFYSFLERTKATGSFTRPGGKNDRITALEEVRLDDSKRLLEVAVAVDLSKMPVEEAYLTSPANWAVTSDKDDPFQVVSIEPLTPSMPHNNDKRFVGTATHLLLLQTDKLSSGLQRLTVTLQKQLPAWIATASTNDDTKIQTQLDKTFGFSYLLEGVNEAFDEPGTDAIHCKLKLELTK